MPVLILKAFDCEKTHVLPPFADRIRLEVDPDLEGTTKITETMRDHDRKRLSDSQFPFEEEVTVKLFTAGAIKLGSTLRVKASELPDQVPETNGRRGLHRGKKRFDEARADYSLWFEVAPDNVAPDRFHSDAIPRRLSLARFLGRTGNGVLTQSVFNEVTGIRHYFARDAPSMRRILELHAEQDGGRSNGQSVRRWIEHHCNPWGQESVIPVEDLPTGPGRAALLSQPNYRPVRSEASVTCAGFVVSTGFPKFDNPATHMSKDRIFDLIPSPQFNYLLAYTAKSRGTATGVGVPRMHCEWESGSMPVEWRPHPGDYVTLHGRHIFDVGHMPMSTEIHPPHTIVIERTEGPILGPHVTRAVIGMGLSGGFPGSVEAELQGELDERWQREFGGFPEDLSLRNRRCWATNLKLHTLRHALYPPVPPPSSDARLTARLLRWHLIQVRNSQLNEFLNACKGGGGQTDVVNNSFASWFPEGLVDEPIGIKPRFFDRGRFIEVEVDLALSEDIPVAFLAEVECAWEE
jgi:hypothetical protein